MSVWRLICACAPLAGAYLCKVSDCRQHAGDCQRGKTSTGKFAGAHELLDSDGDEWWKGSLFPSRLGGMVHFYGDPVARWPVGTAGAAWSVTASKGHC